MPFISFRLRPWNFGNREIPACDVWIDASAIVAIENRGSEGSTITTHGRSTFNVDAAPAQILAELEKVGIS